MRPPPIPGDRKLVPIRQSQVPAGSPTTHPNSSLISPFAIRASILTYLSYDRFPSPKGAATHIDAFARALGSSFGGLSLLTVPPAADEAFEWVADGVEHFPLPGGGQHLFERVRHFRTQIWRWWRDHRNGQPADVVHFRSPMEGYPIARDKRRFAKMLVYEVNGLPSIELKYHYPAVADDDELLTKLRSQEQVCLAAADLVITVSNVNRSHLIDRGVDPERIAVIRNGVDLNTFAPAEAEPRGPEYANSPTDELKLLYAGGLTAWQGVAHAVDALALARRDWPARLTLIGPARSRQRRTVLERAWRAGVADFVEVLPPVPKQELAEYHRRSDIVLAPLTANDRNTVQGCCPLKVVEAMACGSAIVASDLAVVRELASPVEAQLVKPGSAKAIKDGVLELLDPLVRRRLGAAARRRADKEFCWSRAQRELVTCYGRLLDPQQRTERTATNAM
ncbi:MAG: glycosyltransferase family 4 protein [Pirellulaceae bacterium]|nr:glycosyltransferase family 4 protein [Pirellulaceae bacterium]MDP7015264.1 glycosyltransferase family 4 protein [Pirellulaceae bacterium]